MRRQVCDLCLVPVLEVDLRWLTVLDHRCGHAWAAVWCRWCLDDAESSRPDGVEVVLDRWVRAS